MKTALTTLVLALALPIAALAQTPSAATTREIGQLFSALQASGCAFSRNGTWYTAQQASDHLRRKYDYLLKKGMLSSAEGFIELAASKSSLSGRPYLVRCGTAPPVQSGRWFSSKLKALRGDQRGQDQRGQSH